ncbi:MAG: hypothetical protein FWF91_05460 [Coriobacteriia bacterium]|nr:hypothetical protein [Coriobacteriia bacterium]
MLDETRRYLIESIPLRHSVRTFLPEALPEALPEQVVRFFAELSVPFDHTTRMEYFKAEPSRKLYNNGINPVDNLGFLAQTDLVSISKAGFVGELVMLYAVSLGISVCWFGHYKLAEVGRYIAGIATPDRIKQSNLGYGYGKHIDVGERVICCMPMGRKNEQKTRLVDYVAGRNGAGRKPLEELLEDPTSLEGIPADIREVLELAKLAPSAANSQMWRFGFGDDYRTITVAKPVGYKHFKWEHPDVDVGMCASHIWLGLLDKGYNPTVSVRQDEDRAFWSFAL